MIRGRLDAAMERLVANGTVAGLAVAVARVDGDGASGFVLTIDPEADRIVIVVSHTHLRVDPVGWYPRLLALTGDAWDERPA